MCHPVGPLQLTLGFLFSLGKSSCLACWSWWGPKALLAASSLAGPGSPHALSALLLCSTASTFMGSSPRFSVPPSLVIVAPLHLSSASCSYHTASLPPTCSVFHVISVLTQNTRDPERTFLPGGLLQQALPPSWALQLVPHSWVWLVWLWAPCGDPHTLTRLSSSSPGIIMTATLGAHPGGLP